MKQAQDPPPRRPKFIDIISSERDAEFGQSLARWWQDPEKRPSFRSVVTEQEARRYFEERETGQAIIVLYSPELIEQISISLLRDLLRGKEARSKLILWMRGPPPDPRVKEYAPICVPEKNSFDELPQERGRAAIKELLGYVTRPSRARRKVQSAAQSSVEEEGGGDRDDWPEASQTQVQTVNERADAKAPRGTAEAITVRIRSDDPPGFLADTLDGKNHLGTAEEAQRMARLITSWEVVPPLAIGVFGEWGSGKSHFMRTVRTNVEELSTTARATYPAVKQRDAGYYRGIVQIEFNAWHYVRGDLWASLMEHIFTNLRRETAESGAAVKERGSVVLEKILEKREEKRKAQLELDKARADLKAAQTLKGNSEKQADTLNVAKVKLGDVLQADALKNIRTTLGDAKIGEDLEVVAHDLALARRQLRTIGSRIESQARLAREEFGDRKGIAKWAIALALPIAATILAWTLAQPAVITTLSGVSTAAVALFARARPYAQKISDSLDALERAEAEVMRRVELQRERAENEVKEAQVRVQAAAEKVARWEQKVNQVSAGALLREFVAERAECDDYRKHLGLAALVRRDFQALSDLIEEQRLTEVRREEVFDDKTVNRIVLYIDDLDRCPPERVVDVLQAVHLLLAFPLFVVVLAVDARWIRSCLQERYAAALSHRREGEEETFIADPEDYLEKIFQIPYWVRPMTIESTRKYMRGIAAPFAVAASTSSTAAAGGPTEGLDEFEDEGPAGSGTKPSEAQKAPPGMLRLSSSEIEALADVAPLLKRSPRTGKRFLNCYQLVRAGQTGENEAEFLGTSTGHPHYLDLMQMLAIVVGAPEQVPEFELLLRNTQDIRSLVDSITSQDERWLAIRNSLEARLKRAPEATDTRIMSVVLPQMKRFSFHSPNSEGAKLKGLHNNGNGR